MKHLVLILLLLAACRGPRPSSPRAPGVGKPDRGFECHPGETWGECLERECQRRARCL